MTSDVVFLVVGLDLFGLSAVYVAACARPIGEHQRDEGRDER